MNVDISDSTRFILGLDYHPGYIPRHSLQTWLPALWAPWLWKKQFYVSRVEISLNPQTGEKVGQWGWKGK